MCVNGVPCYETKGTIFTTGEYPKKSGMEGNHSQMLKKHQSKLYWNFPCHSPGQFDYDENAQLVYTLICLEFVVLSWLAHA